MMVKGYDYINGSHRVIQETGFEMTDGIHFSKRVNGEDVFIFIDPVTMEELSQPIDHDDVFDLYINEKDKPFDPERYMHRDYNDAGYTTMLNGIEVEVWVWDGWYVA